MPSHKGKVQQQEIIQDVAPGFQLDRIIEATSISSARETPKYTISSQSHVVQSS